MVSSLESVAQSRRPLARYSEYAASVALDGMRAFSRPECCCSYSYEAFSTLCAEVEAKVLRSKKQRHGMSFMVICKRDACCWRYCGGAPVGKAVEYIAQVYEEDSYGRGLLGQHNCMDESSLDDQCMIVEETPITNLSS